jgi:hypothetical protein
MVPNTSVRLRRGGPVTFGLCPSPAVARSFCLRPGAASFCYPLKGFRERQEHLHRASPAVPPRWRGLSRIPARCVHRAGLGSRPAAASPLEPAFQSVPVALTPVTPGRSVAGRRGDLKGRHSYGVIGDLRHHLVSPFGYGLQERRWSAQRGTAMKHHQQEPVGHRSTVEADDTDLALTGIVWTVIGIGALVVVIWPGFAATTAGGALTGGGSWLLKKAFGK